jgi:hypothetical protein
MVPSSDIGIASTTFIVDESEPRKSQETEVYYNHQGKKDQVVTQLEVSGWTQKLVFSNPNVSNSANSGT